MDLQKPTKRDFVAAGNSRLIKILSLTLALLVVTGAFLPDLIWLGARKVTVSDVKPYSGLRLIGTLSDPALSDEFERTGARLDLVEIKNGCFLNKLDPILGEAFVFQWLTALCDANFPAARFENVTRLGPGGALHADIEALGQGRYAIHKGNVVFSLPPGKTSDDIGRLDVRVPASATIVDSAFVLPRWIGLAAITVTFLIVLIWITPPALAGNLGPGLAITAAMFAVLLVGAELYARATDKFPKRMIVWPSTFVPEAGMVFKPNAIVKYTNGFEFWTQDSTNSLGFMDAEPIIPKPPGTFRVLLVGDSIVEALQVPLAQKTQTLLNAAFRKAMPDRNVDVHAVSRSGQGQGSQLGLYNAYRQINPDLVILLFVQNDFSNNSVLLESVRSGFSPDHSPWWFPTVVESEQCKLRPPSVDWDKHMLAKEQDRIARIRSRQGADAKLADTLLDEHMDSVFQHDDPLPAIYQQAVDLTKCSLSLWKEAAQRDGFKLLIVATEKMSLSGKTGQINRLKQMARELQIDLFDLYPGWAERGYLGATRFPVDGHWNANGHRWAAEAIFDHLMSRKIVP